MDEPKQEHEKPKYKERSDQVIEVALRLVNELKLDPNVAVSQAINILR
jgi:hypothetical protein